MLNFKKNYKLLIALLLIIIFSGSFYGHKRRVHKRGYSDFHCYYVAGRRTLEHENIYIQDPNKEVSEFRYAPIFAVIMSGFALMDEAKADTVWYILNFCLLIVSFICLKNLVIIQELTYKQRLTLYILATLGVVRFILHNFDSGQANILMMASILIGLYYISKGREVLGGAIFAFSTMIKYTPLIFIPYFLLKRKVRLTQVTIVSILIYLLLPALFVGFKANILYTKNLLSFLTHSSILDKITILDPKNQSLLSFFYRIFTNCMYYFYAPPMPFQSWNLKDSAINLIFVSSAIILYLMVLYNPKRTGKRYNIDYALLLICLILFNLNAWLHNYIFLWLAYFILVYYLINNHFKDIIVIIFLVLSYILNIITLKPILGKTACYKIHFYSPHTLSALIIFFLLLKIKFTKNSGLIGKRP